MRERGSEEPRGGLGRFGFIPTSRAEYSLLRSLSLNCAVISTMPFVLLYLFIAALVWTINLTCLPKERQSCVAVRDACLSPSDLRNAQSWQTDTRGGLALVRPADCVCLRNMLAKKQQLLQLVTPTPHLNDLMLLQRTALIASPQ